MPLCTAGQGTAGARPQMFVSGLRPALRLEEASYLNKWDDAPHKLDVQVHNPQNQGKLAPVQIQLGLHELLYITKMLQTVK